MNTPVFLLPLLALTGLSIASLAPEVIGASVAQAQVYQPSNRIPVADNTLGTQVMGSNNNFAIAGGVNRGQNTFHSFQDFSVPTNGVATFANPIGNQSIITRVTGNLFSDINGTINTQGANFLLINPNGVVFGPGTQLNVGRVFAASTANGVDLVDGAGRTLSFGTNTAGDGALLLIDPKVVFNVSRFNMGGGNGEIKNFGTLQTNNSNQYIGLLGGNVTLDGGRIEAPGGRVELGGLSAVGSVNVGGEGDSPRLSFLGDVARSNISLINQSRVNIAGATNSDITINSHDLRISDNSIIRGGIEKNSGEVGFGSRDIKIISTGNVFLDSGASIFNSLREKSSGVSGDISIVADSITLNGKSRIGNSNAGNGNSGNLILKANNTVSLDNSLITNGIDSSVTGNGGNVSVIANSIYLRNGSVVGTTSLGKGNSGDTIITAKDKISLEEGSGIGTTVGEGGVGKSGRIIIEANSVDLSTISVISSSNLGKGDSGDILVTAKDQVFLLGSFITSEVLPSGIGKSGDINISGGQISITNSTISSSTVGIGDAGKINLQSSGLIKFDKGSNLKSIAFKGAVGNGNDITIKTGSLILQNGSFVSTAIGAKGKAGNLLIIATGGISLSGKGVAIISSAAPGAQGESGNINIISNTLSIDDQAGVSSANFGTGKAGSINFEIAGELNIIGNEKTAGISSFGTSTGAGGNIFLKIGFLNLQNRGVISSSSTGGGGSSGNIDIAAKNSISLSNKSTIAATTSGGGDGGIINLSSKEITLLNKSSILSSLLAGKGNAGDINFNVIDSVNISDSVIESNTLQGTEGNSGKNKINAGVLNIADNSDISTSTAGKGNAGNVQINVKNGISIIQNSHVSSGVKKEGDGQAGSIDLSSKNLLLQDSTISTTNFGKGDAGLIDIRNSDSTKVSKSIVGSLTGIFVTSQGSSGIAGDIFISSPEILLTSAAISALSTTGSNNGGNIRIADANLIFLRQRGSITTNVGGTPLAEGNGGNININSKIIAAIPAENNDITANAVKGNGGNIGIVSQGLLGIQPSSQQTRNSDITASSTFGQNGNININSPGIDPGKDASKLPTTLIDINNQISQTCSTSQIGNKFTVTGSGGHSPHAEDSPDNDVVWLDTRNPRTRAVANILKTEIVTKITQPAVGWVFRQGKVKLLAANTESATTRTKTICPTHKT